jgi:hypothetical protein
MCFWVCVFFFNFRWACLQLGRLSKLLRFSWASMRKMWCLLPKLPTAFTFLWLILILLYNLLLIYRDTMMVRGYNNSSNTIAIIQPLVSCFNDYYTSCCNINEQYDLSLVCQREYSAEISSKDLPNRIDFPASQTPLIYRHPNHCWLCLDHLVLIIVVKLSGSTGFANSVRGSTAFHRKI